MSPPTTHQDVDDHADRVKRARDRGDICVAGEALITQAELTQDWPALEAMIRAKASLVADGLIASAITLAQARQAAATPSTPV